MKTLKDLAKEAIEIQDASNLSGVVHSFSRTLTTLRDILSEKSDVPYFSTRSLNEHPIAILYASKIASLTGCENGAMFSEAYDWAKDKCNE